MTITALTIFASAGEKNTTGLSLTDGFPAAQKPARQWFNWLFNSLTAKINEIIAVVNTPAATIEPIKIGGLLLTTTAYANAAAVAAGEGYGTWARYAEGRALVGLSDNAPDPTWTKTIGSAPGEYEHTLTINELPSHTHTEMDEESGTAYPVSGPNDGTPTVPVTLSTFDSAQGTGANGYALQSGTTGGDQPHNNVQPSIVIGVWRRTA